MWILLFLLVLSAIAVYLLAVSWRICRPFLMSGRKEEQRSISGARPFEVQTTDGCLLSALWLEAPEQSSRAVIFVHDAGGDQTSLADRANMFLRQGYHVILYSQGRRPSTCGIRERKDLRLLCTVVFRQLGENARLGTLGVGMGAVTALLHACMDSRLSFVIADSPATDLESVLRRRITVRYRMPVFPVLQSCMVLCRVWGGFFVRDVSVKREIERRNGLIALPVLLIHGQADRQYPAAMSEELFRIKQGVKELYLPADTGHGQAWKKDPQEYTRRVEDFLGKNMQERRAAV